MTLMAFKLFFCSMFWRDIVHDFISFCLYISQPRNFFNLFLIFDPFPPRCSYKVCFYKKSVINLSAACIECKFFMQFFLGDQSLFLPFFEKIGKQPFLSLHLGALGQNIYRCLTVSTGTIPVTFSESAY